MNGSTTARKGDSTMTSGTPGSWRTQRSRSASLASASSVTKTARTSWRDDPPEVHRLHDRAVDPVDGDDDPLLAVGAGDDQVVPDVELDGLGVVLAADEEHDRDEQGDERP